MVSTRLIYFSENQIDPVDGSVLRQLNNILSASNRNNELLGLTGALIFDDRWFLQALEGERDKVWQTLRRIELDDRHTGLVVVEAVEVPERLFANWWMGLAVRSSETEAAFAPFLKNGFLHPKEMSASSILKLMVSLARRGLSRRLAVAAKSGR